MNEKDKIWEFVRQNITDVNLSDDDDMVALRFLDSLVALRLVNFVEQAFGIQVEADELDVDNFRSVNAINNFVRRKRG